MIFLRQKHFSYANSNHRSRNLNRGQSRVLNRYPASSGSNRSTGLHPNLIRLTSSSNNTPSASTNVNNANSSQTSTNNPNINSTQNLNYIRSVTINERLASIGGLFGVLSIVITGALLYAIFTANNEDKLYYIIAVLINVSLLVILMISAILFDRFYLKKLSNSNTSNMPTSSVSTNNEISVRPSSNNDEENNLNSTYNLINTPNFRLYNDVPPRYPGIIEQNETISSNTTSNNNSSSDVNNSTSPILQSSIILVNPIKTNTNTSTRKSNTVNATSNNVRNNSNNIYDISSQLNNDRSPSTVLSNRSSMNHHSSYIPSTFNVYLDPNSNSQFKNELIVDDKNLKTITSNLNTNSTTNLAKTNTHPPPPNYFDLYPIKENDTQLILNHNIVLNTLSSNNDTNNSGHNGHDQLPSTSTPNRSSRVDQETFNKIKSGPSSK